MKNNGMQKFLSSIQDILGIKETERLISSIKDTERKSNERIIEILDKIQAGELSMSKEELIKNIETELNKIHNTIDDFFDEQQEQLFKQFEKNTEL